MKVFNLNKIRQSIVNIICKELNLSKLLFQDEIIDKKRYTTYWYSNIGNIKAIQNNIYNNQSPVIIYINNILST